MKNPRPKPRHVIVAIHGIMTGRSSPTWPERFEHFITTRHSDVVVLTDQYTAGPFPRLNWFFRNPRRGRHTASLVEDWLAAGNIKSLSFVAHSNGCDIARRAIIELEATYGPGVATAIFTSPPLPASLDGMGLTRAIDSGHLKRLLVYAADCDRVLGENSNWRRPWTLAGRIARWPYGNAGRVGISQSEHVNGFAETDSRVVSRMFRGWGHSDFFPRGQRLRTENIFRLIERDLFR